MTRLTAYRLSTAIFAILFAAMVVRDLVRPGPDVTPAPAVSVAGDAPDATVPREKTEDLTRAEAGAGVDPASAPGTDDGSVRPVEPALDLAIRLLSPGSLSSWSGHWKEAVELLPPRKHEILPILEDWIGRLDEIRRAGVPVGNVLMAYALLAGPDAIPLLEGLDTGEEPLPFSAIRALLFIDDPRAVAIVVAAQEAWPDASFVVSPREMWKGAPAFRALVRTWTVSPPGNRAWIGENARSTVFRHGTSEDRERLWSRLDDREKLTNLTGGLADRWGGEWPHRFRASVERGMTSREVSVRFLAADRIGRAAGRMPPEWVANAEEILLAVLRNLPERVPGDRVVPSRSTVEISLERVLEWRRETEAEKQKREALTPRD